MTPSCSGLARLALTETLAVVVLVLAHGALTDPVTALMWWSAAAITAWLVATTTLCIASRVAPARRRLRAIDALTAPGVRRLVDAAFACSLAVGAPVVAAAPAHARTAPTTAAPPVVYVTPDGHVVISPATTTTTTTAAPPTTTTTTPAPDPTVPEPRAPRHRDSPAPSCRAREGNRCGGATRTSAAGAAAATYVVVAGDNLWSIAAAHVGATRAADVAPYWRRVVDANRTTLRSGDPNLILPGELVVLPPFV
jgi:hypothetical protein